MLLNNLQNNYKYALAKMRLDSHKSFMLANLAQAWWPRLYHEWWRVKATPTIFANFPIADSISRVSWKLALNAWGMHSNEQTNVGISGFIKFDSFKLPQSHLEDKIYPLVLRGFMIHTPTPNYPVFNLLMHLHSHIFSMGSYYFIYLIGYISWHVYPIHLFRHRT